MKNLQTIINILKPTKAKIIIVAILLLATVSTPLFLVIIDNPFLYEIFGGVYFLLIMLFTFPVFITANLLIDSINSLLLIIPYGENIKPIIDILIFTITGFIYYYFFSCFLLFCYQKSKKTKREKK
ncbi:MAG: hypothetical protein U9N04_00510 [Patescibacteria group bacterium]|nr:hypothetical protein [Patescibacteria group bacterium]